MTSNVKRYTYTNPRIGNDALKLGRIPLTDSMGNYLNWNVGTNGVTIGSDDNINGIITNSKFPVLETKEIVIGLENKLLPNDKKGVVKSKLAIESASNYAQLIIENEKDVS